MGNICSFFKFANWSYGDILINAGCLLRSGIFWEDLTMVGKVKWFNAERGYGFIKQATGGDLFVHYSAIDAKGFRCLETGQSVEYEVVSVNNRQEAAHVTKL